MQLYEHQKKAINKMHNGCILVGGVGSGKSLTSIYYYFHKVCNGMKRKADKKDLYIITTARKRDTNEWDEEMSPFALKVGDSKVNKWHHVNVVVDSWNNIKKYADVKNAFFIFDEQRLVSMGTWSKHFIKISRSNQWILLSATPGDTWSDYMSVFIANGFVKNKTEFNRRYCVFSRFSKFPKIERYLEEERLAAMRNRIIVVMKYKSDKEKIHKNVFCGYNKDLYLTVAKTRWNYDTDAPCKDAGEVCRCLRKLVNSSVDRVKAMNELLNKHDKVIVFYNYNYELDILKALCNARKLKCAEWNGHVHELIPTTKKWCYLVQYSAGAEGWNCIETDTIIFYSANYSYKIMHQAAGRIDRITTPFDILYYYHLISKSSIDGMIDKAIKRKKTFNEKMFVEKQMTKDKLMKKED